MIRQLCRRKRHALALMAAVFGWTPKVGCIPFDGRQFRGAALPALETGVNAILDGLVDGLFATIAVESPPNE